MRADEPPTDQIARLETILESYLAAGITTVLELGGPLDIDCRLRERNRTGSPTTTAELLFAGPSFTGIDGWPLGLHHNRSLVREVGDPDTARRMVYELADDTDFVKCIYDGEPEAPDKLPRSALQAIVVAAHERGKSVLVHIATARDIADAVDAGADCIEHTFIPNDPNEVDEAHAVAALLARAGVYFSPTLVVFEQIGRSGDRAYLDELVESAIITEDEAYAIAASKTFGSAFPHHPATETLARFRYGMRILPIMRDAGVKIVAGSDVAFFMSRPAALLREMQLFAQAGLSTSDVMVAATRHVAEKIGRGKDAGSIAVGQIADALLIDADPLADIMHIVRAKHRRATICRGRLSGALSVST